MSSLVDVLWPYGLVNNDFEYSCSPPGENWGGCHVYHIPYIGLEFRSSAELVTSVSPGICPLLVHIGLRLLTI